MNEIKSTPGPWEFRRWTGDSWPEDRWSVGQSITNGTAICISPRYFTEGEESEANAKLIAATPDLLQALITAEDTLNKLNINSVCDNSLYIVRTAIKKATS
ncbi:MAG: hypothetical protein JWQ09_4404 [Segetibacter sp.]|nr:hypothetical protein [Segetibacter sp.]